MSNSTDMTQLRVRKDTLTNLKKIGKMGESYNDVIDRLIDEKNK